MDTKVEKGLDFSDIVIIVLSVYVLVAFAIDVLIDIPIEIRNLINYFDIDDPKSVSTEGSWEWKSGTMGTLYRIYIDEKSDIEYTLFLIKQKYNQLIKE